MNTSFFGKVFLVVIFIIPIFFSGFPKKVLSQENEVEVSVSPTQSPRNLNLAYQAYLNSISTYQNAHSIYLQRKAQYLQFGTLKSRQDAHDATVTMMQARTDVVISYFLALKEKLEISEGVSEPRKVSLNLRIDTETSWLREYKISLTAAESLEDLENKSREAESRWKSSEPLVYEILSTISQGKVVDFSSRTEEVFTQLKSKLEEIRQTQDENFKISQKKFEVLDRWVLETEQRIGESKKKMAIADNVISEFAVKQGRGLNSYNQVVTTLSEAQLNLREANTFMKEIIREVKTKDI
jgi:hypothetical protein